MKVSVIRPYNIKNIILPENVSGSYWIDGLDINGIKKNLISIEADNGKWRLNSNNEVYVADKGVMVPTIYLENYKFYSIVNEVDKESFLIYTSPILEKYNTYELGDNLDKGISIGSSRKCMVNFNIIDEIACQIIRKENRIILINNNAKNGVYVNNARVINKKELKIGDNIFISGLRIILSVLNDSNAYAMLINNASISSITVSILPTGEITSLYDTFTESEVESEFPLYNDNEYFYKKPRVFPKLEALDMNVDAPPNKQDHEDRPFLLTIGPMLTMSMTSFVSMFSTLNAITNGETTWKNARPQLIICGAMIASVFIWPLLTKWYTKFDNMKRERKRQKKYRRYIDEKKYEIKEAIKTQTDILKRSLLTSYEASQIILGKSPLLWQRRISDYDYLDVNLGSGNIPMKININYPEEHFSLDEDNLKDMVAELGKEEKILIDVPVPYSFKEHYISGLFGLSNLHDYMRRLLIQILAFHSYEDLKIVILTDEERESEWSYLRSTPHIFSDDKQIRFFATNTDEYKEVCYYLNRIFESRAQNSSDNKQDEYKQLYLVITDSIKKVREFDLIQNILEFKNYLGFSLVVIDSKMTNIPDQCTSFIDLSMLSDSNNIGEVKDNLKPEENKTFKVDLNTEIDYEACVKVLANTPIEIKNEVEGMLPNKINFLEMYDVGKVEQLNSLVRWKKNNPILNLSVPVGVGKNGENITIDLHEKYHGPHGLIAGMTGSGKSEFIITYILSMALNYHPYEVQFILIDYKGGGLAGAFENNQIGLKLPHLVGTITNLDKNEITRSLASIESELKRRQALFNKAREKSGESTVDIYKYQQMYREGIIDEPVSHLFIISDEFAELKNQQPEFMEQLISTARIGRSLGVHLILATQKPSGVVDPQIWSNTRFRICLRVQDKSDSQEVLKKPDAAYLKNVGRFYFQVGYDEVFTIGQAAYAGGKYIPTDKVTKELDTSIDFINNIGYITKKIDTKIKKEVKVVSEGEELSNIVKYLDGLAKTENIKCKPLWLPKMPEYINVEDLMKKYEYKKTDYILNPVIGELDNPSNQEQLLLTMPITANGNALIYGASGSGKENFITTLIYSSMISYSPEEVNYYIIDFGSGSLKMLSDSPIVGDIINSDSEEKINNLFKMVATLIEQRKKLFADYNGDYETFIKNSGKKVPNIVVIINNYEAYDELYDSLQDELNLLSRECTKYAIYFILAVNSPNGVRYKLKQNFALTYALGQNNEEDFITILGSVNKKYPDKKFGRGIIKTDDVYEFQTASAAFKDTLNTFVRSKCAEYLNKYPNKAKKVPILPETVTYNDIKEEFGKNKELVIGIEKEELNICKFDMNKNLVNLITSIDFLSMNHFINPLINQIIGAKIAKLMVINADEMNIDMKYTSKYQYVNSNFDNIFEQLYNYITSNNEKYIANNYNRDIFNNTEKIYCMIIGLDAFKNKLNDEHKKVFEDIFVKAKDLGIINYIFVDSVDNIKKSEYESWFKTCVNANNGIYLGNGINDQYTIKISQKIPSMKLDVPNNFCFVIKRGKPYYVKYVEVLNLKVD